MKDFRKREDCDCPDAMAHWIEPATGFAVPAPSLVSNRKNAAKSRTAAKPTARSGAAWPFASGILRQANSPALLPMHVYDRVAIVLEESVACGLTGVRAEGSVVQPVRDRASTVFRVHEQNVISRGRLLRSQNRELACIFNSSVCAASRMVEIGNRFLRVEASSERSGDLHVRADLRSVKRFSAFDFDLINRRECRLAGGQRP